MSWWQHFTPYVSAGEGQQEKNQPMPRNPLSGGTNSRYCRAFLSCSLAQPVIKLSHDSADKACMGKSVFVVDDDPVVRILVTEYLRSVGYHVCALENARACLERLFDEKPDLLFVDMQMPGMNGAELLQIIRHTPELEQLPVVILSAGSDTQAFTENNYHVRADSYLSKPFDIGTLSALLERIMSRDTQTATLSAEK